VVSLRKLQLPPRDCFATVNDPAVDIILQLLYRGFDGRKGAERAHSSYPLCQLIYQLVTGGNINV
jgi:hypothetical protein